MDSTTVRDALHLAAGGMRQAGIANARDEAIRIWADLTHATPAAVVLHSDLPAEGDQLQPFLQAVGRRTAGEPLAYVTGTCGFRRLLLHCDRRALIPRPETEGLVEAALARVRAGVAADIGTGTGAIALALRDEGEFDEVMAVDRSAEALDLARANARATGLAVTWLHGDLLAPLAGRQVHLLISNPPYLTRGEYDTLDGSVRDYEPRMALVAGEQGQEIITRLLREAPAAVVDGGWIALEVDCRRAEDTGRVAQAAGWREVSVLDDLFGRARYVLARRGSTP